MPRGGAQRPLKRLPGGALLPAAPGWVAKGVERGQWAPVEPRAGIRGRVRGF